MRVELLRDSKISAVDDGYHGSANFGREFVGADFVARNRIGPITRVTNLHAERLQPAYVAEDQNQVWFRLAQQAEQVPEFVGLRKLNLMKGKKRLQVLFGGLLGMKSHHVPKRFFGTQPHNGIKIEIGLPAPFGHQAGVRSQTAAS